MFYKKKIIIIANIYFPSLGCSPLRSWGPENPLDIKKRSNHFLSIVKRLNTKQYFLSANLRCVLCKLTHIILRTTPWGRYFICCLLLEMRNWGMKSSGNCTRSHSFEMVEGNWSQGSLVVKCLGTATVQTAFVWMESSFKGEHFDWGLFCSQRPLVAKVRRDRDSYDHHLLIHAIFIPSMTNTINLDFSKVLIFIKLLK